MSTFKLTCNLKSPDGNKQFISNIPRIMEFYSITGVSLSKQTYTPRPNYIHRSRLFHYFGWDKPLSYKEEIR